MIFLQRLTCSLCILSPERQIQKDTADAGVMRTIWLSCLEQSCQGGKLIHDICSSAVEFAVFQAQLHRQSLLSNGLTH